MRSSIVSIGSPGSGGRPRPSLKWQPEQDRALNSGPRPSRPATDAGAIDPVLVEERVADEERRAMLLPKIARRQRKRVARARRRRCVSPPDSASARRRRACPRIRARASDAGQHRGGEGVRMPDAHGWLRSSASSPRTAAGLRDRVGLGTKRGDEAFHGDPAWRVVGCREWRDRMAPARPSLRRRCVSICRPSVRASAGSTRASRSRRPWPSIRSPFART